MRTRCHRSTDLASGGLALPGPSAKRPEGLVTILCHGNAEQRHSVFITDPRPVADLGSTHVYRQRHHPAVHCAVDRFIREERLTASKIAGVLLGLAGVAILRGQGADISSAQTLGIVLCLGAALSFGFSGLWGQRKLQGVPPHISAFCQLLCSTMVLIPLSAAIEQPWTREMPGVPAWLSLIGLGALSTALAYIVFFRILARSGATNVMLVTLLMPITTVVLGISFWVKCWTAVKLPARWSLRVHCWRSTAACRVASSACCKRNPSAGPRSAFQIGDQIVGILDADRQPHQPALMPSSRAPPPGSSHASSAPDARSGFRRRRGFRPA